MVDVVELTKVYPGRRGQRRRALDRVSFSCQRGEIFALLGRNGAGKTTALRILATILPPTAGSARVEGADVERDGEAVRRKIGFHTGETRLYDRLTGREALVYFGRLHDLPEDTIRSRVSLLAARLGLEGMLDQRIGRLSSGYRQRLSLARTLVHDPPILILDEPTSGLDILGVSETLELLRGLRADGRTIIFSTHVLTEVEKVGDRVGVLENGRLLACEDVASLQSRHGGALEQAFISLVRGAESRPAIAS